MWVNGSDFYLGARSNANRIKVSFHESGQRHLAFSKEFETDHRDDNNWNMGDRFIEKWMSPRECTRGVVLEYRIVVPMEEMRCIKNELASSDKIIWIDAHPVGSAIEFAILVSSPSAQIEEEWPGRRKMGSKLAGSMRLANGERLWLVYNIRSTTDEEVQMLAETRAKCCSRKPLVLIGDATSPRESWRLWVNGPQEDGSRYLYDITGDMITLSALT